jgi:hypothetical protein
MYLLINLLQVILSASGSLRKQILEHAFIHHTFNSQKSPRALNLKKIIIKLHVMMRLVQNNICIVLGRASIIHYKNSHIQNFLKNLQKSISDNLFWTVLKPSAI